VTEDWWKVCTDPHKMLEFLRDRACERKTRLFACALARCLWPLLGTDRSRRAVEVAERFADGLAPKREMTRAGVGAQQTAWTVSRTGPRFKDGRTAAAFTTARYAAYARIWDVAVSICQDAEVAGVSDPLQCDLLHDLFGPLPFCPVVVPPTVLTWHDGTVVRLAQAAYRERDMPTGTLDNGRLAVLAEALEEAGCSVADILGHLRGPGTHVRGCWVVDLLLGKE
jgi:hypothetical protein